MLDSKTLSIKTLGPRGHNWVVLNEKFYQTIENLKNYAKKSFCLELSTQNFLKASN